MTQYARHPSQDLGTFGGEFAMTILHSGRVPETAHARSVFARAQDVEREAAETMDLPVLTQVDVRVAWANFA